MNQPAAQPAPLPPAPEGMVNVFVDGVLMHARKGSTVMKACESAGKEIPHFCYHERLTIAGNCRMCLVEIEGMPKPVASCHWPVAEGMKIKTDSGITHIARKGTMELLLANHPLDCPICDQGGECTLQDLAVGYGSDRSHYNEMKRAVDDKFIGNKIKTVMTRCIHCTRCVRFATEIAGVEEFGATGRGENMQIGTYVEHALQSELAGNMIDLCPVGALTNAQYAFKARPWEVTETNTIDILEPSHAAIQVHSRAGEVLRIVPRENPAINEEWIADTTRFACDALHHNRLTTPLLKSGKIATETGWPQAFAAIKSALKPGAKVAMAVGPLLAQEDMFAAQQFMHTLGGAITALPQGLPESLPRSLPSLTDIERAPAILLIGTNPRQQSPLLNLRIRKAVRKNRAQVFNLGHADDLTYPVTQLGQDARLLSSLKDLKELNNVLKSQGSIILVGHAALTRKDASAILSAAQKLASATGAKLALLHPTTGILGALDLGLQTLAPEKLTSQLDAGKIDVLFVYGDHPALDAKALKNTFTVYLGTHKTELSGVANIALPTAAYTEKSATYTNLEGLHQTTAIAAPAPHNAKEDWKIFRALSEELGQKLRFDTLLQLRSLMPRPLESQTAKAEGSIAPAPLTASTASFYLSNAFLQQSPWMHKLAAETAMKRKVA